MSTRQTSKSVLFNRATRAVTIAALASGATAGTAWVVTSALAADAPAKKPADPKKAAAAAADAAAKAEANKGTALDPAKAGPDFAVQGEYVGQIGGGNGGPAVTIGAQIASLGNGDFSGAFYTGGLPGEGWDGEHRFAATGKAKDATMTEVPFLSADGNAPTGQAVWAGGTIKISLRDGGSFELKKVVRKSPTLGAKPPEGAVVLFDGSDKDKVNVDAWDAGHVDDRGWLAAGTKTKKKFQNFTLHGEFILPFKPLGRDQDRGNSGFYLQDRYEVQVLDSFGQPPVFNGTGAIYRQTPPDLNMCLPPLQWQTYDIDFTAPQFDAAGKKTKNAVITVKLNGVAVHNKREITAKTGAGKPEGAEPGPIQLQGHGNPVFYRNIWIVEH
jgi:hypothetical protein